MEKLFLLEVLVENVEIDYTKVDVDKKVLDAAKQLCIKIQFLSFPELTICEEDFCPSPDGDYKKSSINIKSGKSCLFSIRQWKAEDRSMPLTVTVLRTNPSPPHITVGKACINLGSSFTNILAAAQSSEYTETITKKCTDVYVLTNNNGTDVGKLRMFVRLTCFGPLIVTQFQISGDENNSFLFRGNDGSGIVTFNRNNSSELAPQPVHIPTGQVPCGGSQQPKYTQDNRSPDCPPCPPCPPCPQEWNTGQGMMPQGEQGMMPQSGQGMMAQGGQGMMPQGGQGMPQGGQGMTPQGGQGMPQGGQGMMPWGAPGGQTAMPVMDPGIISWGEPMTIMTAGGQGMMPDSGFMVMPGGGQGMMPGGDQGVIPGGGQTMMPGFGGGQAMMPGGGPGMIPGGGPVMMPGGGPGMIPGGEPGMLPGGGPGMIPGAGQGMIVAAPAYGMVGGPMMPFGEQGMMVPGGEQNDIDYKEFGAEVNGHSLSIKVLRKPRIPKKVPPPPPICGHIPIAKTSSSSSSEEETPPSQPPIQFCECDYPLPPGFSKNGYMQGSSPMKKKKKKKVKDNNFKCPLECSGDACLQNYMLYKTLNNARPIEAADKMRNPAQPANKLIGMLGDVPANQKATFKTFEEPIHTSGNPAFILNIPPKPIPLQNKPFENPHQSEQAKFKSKRVIENWTQYNEKDVAPFEKQPGTETNKKDNQGSKKKKGKKPKKAKKKK
ncbi:unnamed protein product [Nezara viridula]|uniref:Uncharacterized protein n=1 Tax=Nezara viridula TaxID=85310 RepID=A0A9P0EEZ0_NEZVI|nr:unnamed protein product [Nezara viridula]